VIEENHPAYEALQKIPTSISNAASSNHQPNHQLNHQPNPAGQQAV